MRHGRVTFILVGALLSCSQDDEIGNLPPVSDFTYQDQIDKISLIGTQSRDPNGDPLSYAWSSSSNTILIRYSNLPEAEFNLPNSTKDETAVITLKVSDGKQESVSTQSILVPALTKIRSYGLGKNLATEVSNSVPYEWYIDQSTSGTHALVNCGPAAVTMSIKWANETFTGTAEDARAAYRPGGGWWYTSDIIGYLNTHTVYNKTVPLASMEILKEELDRGSIAILCLDMFMVAFNGKAEGRVNKFYDTQNAGWGHFMVIKGYKVVDGQLFFEAYDSYSWNNTYADQTLKGKDRYYKSVDLDRATQIWWDYAIVISGKGATGGRVGVDNSRIVHMPGR